MLGLVWLVILVIVIAAIVMVVRNQQTNPGGTSASPSPGTSLKRTLFTLQLGDIVQHEGIDWVVEDRLTYEEDGDIWLEYKLQDGEELRWLSVEEDDRIEICWMENASDLEMSHNPPKEIEYHGITYLQKEAGVAKMSRQTAVLNKGPVTCHYFDYSAPDLQRLSVEIWNGDVEITVGKRVPLSSVSLLPGDGQRVYED